MWTFTFMHLADAFIQIYSGYTFFYISMCVPWQMNPQPFVLLAQCSTTELQEHCEQVLLYLFKSFFQLKIFSILTRSNKQIPWEL